MVQSQSEYIDGEIVPLTARSPNHNDIAGHFYAHLKFSLKGQNSKVFIGDLRLSIPRYHLYTYPDVMVVKGEPVLLDDRTYTIINPLAIVEVLSKSTKNYDQSEDTHIFDAPKAGGDVILMTQDRDFIELVERYGSPPQVIWLTCGNTSNDRLKEIMTATLPNAIELLRLGESVVEITGN